MQPVEDPPLGQRDDGVRLAPRVVLQRPVRVYESLVLLLEGHDARREQAAEAEAVALRHGERRVLVVPWVVEDVVAALVHDAGPRDGGAGARLGRGRRQEPPDLRRPPRRRTPHRRARDFSRHAARPGVRTQSMLGSRGRRRWRNFEGGASPCVRAPAVRAGQEKRPRSRRGGMGGSVGGGGLEPGG